MASTNNYIDESERLFSESTYFVAFLSDLWTSDATLEPDSIIYQDVEYGSLLAKDGASFFVKYNIWGDPSTDIPSQFAITTLVENSDYIESYAWVRPTKNCTIDIYTTLTKVSLDVPTSQFKLSTDPSDVLVGSKGFHRISIGATDEPQWHLVRGIPIQIPDNESQYSIGITLEVDFDDVANPGQINISRPASIRTHAFLDNPMFVDVGTFMPRVFLAKDEANFLDNEPTYPLSRLIDVATSTADEVYQKHDAIEYLDIDSGFSNSDSDTFSTLVSPLVADGDTLRWLAQFRGRGLVVTYEPSTEGEEWELFVLDESVLDGTDVLATSSIPTTGFSGGVEEYFKWQTQFGYYGHNAGTITAMLSAIKLLLSGNKTVVYTQTANTIHFQTSITETFGGDVLSIGDSSPYVTSILEPTRPLGMIITHELVA